MRRPATQILNADNSDVCADGDAAAAAIIAKPKECKSLPQGGKNGFRERPSGFLF